MRAFSPQILHFPHLPPPQQKCFWLVRSCFKHRVNNWMLIFCHWRIGEAKGAHPPPPPSIKVMTFILLVSLFLWKWGPFSWGGGGGLSAQNDGATLANKSWILPLSCYPPPPPPPFEILVLPLLIMLRDRPMGNSRRTLICSFGSYRPLSIKP